MKNLDALKERIKELIDKGENVRKTADTNGRVDESKNISFGTAALAFLLRLYGKEHPYSLTLSQWNGGSIVSRVENCLGVLYSVQEELDQGWLFTVKGLVTSEVFSDFLDMATYFLADDYKDQAAVIAGSALEQHLRQLCNKNNIPLDKPDKNGKKKPKMGGALNDDLARVPIYQKIDHKNVVAWLDIRNSAAHGKFSDYTQEQVKLMVQGIADFIARNPL